MFAHSALVWVSASLRQLLDGQPGVGKGLALEPGRSQRLRTPPRPLHGQGLAGHADLVKLRGSNPWFTWKRHQSLPPPQACDVTLGAANGDVAAFELAGPLGLSLPGYEVGPTVITSQGC